MAGRAKKRIGGSTLLLRPGNMTANARIGQQRFLRIVIARQLFLVGYEFVDSPVAEPAKQELAVAHLRFAEPVDEALLAVNGARNEVMFSERYFPAAELAAGGAASFLHCLQIFVPLYNSKPGFRVVPVRFIKLYVELTVQLP